MIGGSLSAMSIGALSGFFVLSAVDAGVSEGTAGVILAGASLVGLVVRVGAGWVADRLRSTGLDLVAALLVVGSLGFAMLASGRAVLVVPGAALAFGAGWGWPGVMHYGVVRTHRDAPGAATAFVHVGMSLGGGLGPLLFGFVAERAGFAAAWSAATGMALVGAAAILRAHRRLAHRLVPVAAGQPEVVS
jgi:MFS family permease